MTTLEGASVRLAQGDHGRVVKITPESLTIAWQALGQIPPRARVYSLKRETSLLQGIEVLTLEQGWVPLPRLLSSQKAEELRFRALRAVELVQEITSPFCPYKGADVTVAVPGPRGRTRPAATGEWECSCSKGECYCVSRLTGREKQWRVNAERKRAYDREYRRHRRHNRLIRARG